MFLMLLAAIGSQAAPTSSSEIEMGNGNQAMDLLSFLDRGVENVSSVTYPTSKFKINTFENILGDYENELFMD